MEEIVESSNLNWSNYADHLKEMLHEMMKSNDLTDITIVCDDKRYLRAHKVVLGACSPFFKGIVNDLPHNSMVYLKGIQSEEMQKCIEFMYLGQATFCQGKMDQFLEAANNLEIREISKNIVFDMSEKIDDVWGEDSGPSETKTLSSKRFKCPDCDKEFTSIPNVNSHHNSQHKGIKFNCHQCDYQATQKVHLKTHIETVHEGKFHKCNLCDQEVSTKQALKVHVQRKHSEPKIPKKYKIEGGEFSCKVCTFRTKYRSAINLHLVRHFDDGEAVSCKQCDYKASQQRNLKNHVLLVHEGKQLFPCRQCKFIGRQKSGLNVHIRTKHTGTQNFACTQCDYKTSLKSTLKNHVDAQHEGKKYPCEICDYKASQSSNLKQHVLSVHEKIRPNFSSSHQGNLKLHKVTKHDTRDKIEKEIIERQE